MTRTLLCAAFLFLSACGHQPANGSGTADNSDARKTRILANLKNEFPQLDQLQVSLAEAKRNSYGMDEIDMVINGPHGEQKQLLLVSPDDKALYMVMRGPIDVTKSAEQITAAKAKEAEGRTAELKTLAQSLPARGNPNGPVTVVEFSDFQCPFCKRGYETAEQLLQKHGDKVRFVFAHYPLPFHPWAKPAAIAATCAGDQKPEAFWALHDAYFKNQEAITLENVNDKSAEFLASSGIDKAKWENCAKNTESPEHKATAKRVDEQMALGEKLGVEGTPAFFINGELVSGAVPLSELERVMPQ